MGDVIMTTTTLHPPLTTAEVRRLAEAIRQIAERGISLTPALGLWVASVDIKGAGHNRKRAIESVSAIGMTPAAAVNALVEKLSACGESQLRREEEDHHDFDR
jgi:hypothetical protein